MSEEYKFELSITLAGNGNSARDVIELYGMQIQRDINQTAWNVCNCNDQVQNERFGSLQLKNWSVVSGPGNNLIMKAHFTVNAQTPKFINDVVEEFMDGFADFSAEALNGYYSRTGKRAAMELNPLDWDVDFK